MKYVLRELLRLFVCLFVWLFVWLVALLFSVLKDSKISKIRLNINSASVAVNTSIAAKNCDLSFVFIHCSFDSLDVFACASLCFLCWLLCARLKAHVLEIQCRFLSCLTVDESFNKMKCAAGAGTNTRITPARAMAHVIDKKLLSELNHFSEISKEDGDGKRYGPLPGDVFKPSLRVKKLPEGERALKLGNLVGQDAATWWSPQATSLFKPLAQKLVARECYLRGMLRQTKYAWLSQLATNNMMLRRKGTFAPWFIVIGNVLGCLTKCWQAHFDLAHGFGVRRNGR